MPGFVAIDPDGARALAAVLDELGDEAQLLGVDVRRWAELAAIDVARAEQLRVLGGASHAAGVVLRRRSALAASFGIALVSSLATASRRDFAAAPASAECTLGPASVLGSSSPCDPVERVELISVEGGLSLAGAGLAPSVAAVHAYRVEHLRSGQLRVTRLDRVALGVGVSLGRDVSIAGDGGQLDLGGKAEGVARVLAATGDTYEIDAGDLHDFVVADIVDRSMRVPPMAGLSPAAAITVGRATASIADHLPSGPLHGLVHRVHVALDARLPTPISRFVEGGGEGRASLALVAKALFGVSLAGASHAVVGFERRDRAGADVLYVDIGGELRAAMQRSILGRTSTDTEDELRLALVRRRDTASLSAIEFSFVERVGDAAERRTVVVDLTDPDARRAVAVLRDAGLDGGRIAAALAALLALPSTAISTTRWVRTGDDADGVEVAGNGVRITRRTFDVVTG